MRISDWSSDVCSSDAAAATDAAVTDAAAATSDAADTAGQAVTDATQSAKDAVRDAANDAKAAAEEAANDLVRQPGNTTRDPLRRVFVFPGAGLDRAAGYPLAFPALPGPPCPSFVPTWIPASNRSPTTPPTTRSCRANSTGALRARPKAAARRRAQNTSHAASCRYATASPPCSTRVRRPPKSPRLPPDRTSTRLNSIPQR